jgi:predicted glycoside hydrolase/deacetylase ChbG (UPF0249 family)
LRIILNADDFGMCDDTVRATIECFERGALTSATIMPKMPATAQAVEYARAHPQFSFGIHLTFVTDTVEAPFSDPAQIPALTAPDGKFVYSQVLRRRALLGRVPVDQVERETRAQIGFLIDRGVRLSHVDSHGHLHKFAPFVAALRRVLPDFGITRVRNAQDLYLRKPLTSPTYWFGGVWRRRIMRTFRTTPHFFMPTNLGDAERLASLLDVVPDGREFEVGVHPGYAEPWRDAERRAVQDFAPRARGAGNALISWNDL